MKIEACDMPPWKPSDSGEQIFLNQAIVAAIVAHRFPADTQAQWSRVTLMPGNTVFLRGAYTCTEFYVKGSPTQLAAKLAGVEP